MRKGLLFIIFLFTAQAIHAQQPAHKIYGISDGLPEQRVLEMAKVRDSLFLVFTKGKISYFDGIDFEPYPSPKANTIFTYFFALKKGKIMIFDKKDLWYQPDGKGWIDIKDPKRYFTRKDSLFGHFQHGLFHFEEKKKVWKQIKIFSPTFSNTLDSLVSLGAYGNYTYGKNNKQAVLTLGLIKETTEPRQLFYHGQVFNRPFYVHEITQQIHWDYCDNINQQLAKKQFVYLNTSIDEANKSISSPTCFIQNIEDEYFFSSADTACYFEYMGMLQFANIRIKKKNKDLFFIGSYDGLYKVNPLISYYSKNNSNINTSLYAVVFHNNTIYTGGYGSGLSKLEGHQFSKIDLSDLAKYSEKVLGATAISPNEAWFFTESSKALVQLKNHKLSDFQIYINGQISNKKGYHIDTLSNGQMAFGLQENNFGLLEKIEQDKIYIKSISKEKGIDLINVQCFTQDSKDRVWMGRAATGVALYDLEKDTAITFHFDEQNPKSFGILSCMIDEFDQLWLGTSQGLYLLPAASSFKMFEEELFEKAIPIPLPNRESILIKGIQNTKDYIVVGSNESISFIPKAKYPNGLNGIPIHQKIFGEDINGAGVVQQGFLYDQKRFLWAACNQGLVKIDMDGITIDTTSVTIDFRTLKSSGKEIDLIDNNIHLGIDRRNLSFSFKPKKNPSLLNNIYYNYLISNSKGDTISYSNLTQNKLFTIQHFTPDTYSFKINAYKNGLLMDSKQLKISVPYAWGESPLFWLVLLLLGGLALGGFWYYRNQQLIAFAENELLLSKLQHEKEQLKVQAIISTFNPHFINNSLHWVQSRYYEDEPMVKMVGSLSRNISYIFKQTRNGQAVHDFKAELELVNNYVAIQQLRFDNSFEYRSPSQADIEKYRSVPIIVMQIQIHVENAIEHGIRNSKKGSFVTVDIFEKGDSYNIQITDDGIGRQAAKAIASQGTQMGTKMLKELHTIFNALPENKQKLKTIYEDDIFEREEKTFGTRVTITIPKHFRYTL